MGNRIYRKVLFWRDKLGLTDYPVRVFVLHPMQVTDENGEAGVNLVGGRLGENGVIHIYRTRKLKEDDVIHELLHIRFPEDNEVQVRRMTSELIISRNVNYQETQSSRERF